MKYKLREDGFDFGEIECEPDEVQNMAQEKYPIYNCDYGNPEETIWITWYAIPENSNDPFDVIEIEFAIEPEEPFCNSDATHDWCSDIDLVGGIKENPGVWGHGGGVIIHEACRNCNWNRITDTWAQNRANGKQGLTSIRFSERETE